MSELLEAVSRYGSRAIPLHPSSKRPVGTGWTTREWTAAQLREHFERHRDANIGIRTGNRLVVLDIDTRAGGDRNLATLEAEHGPLPMTPTVHTGGGGRHYYLRAPDEASGRTLLPGVELKDAGRQVVAPPSIHRNGRQYVWDPRNPYDPAAIADAPSWVLELGREPAARRSDSSALPTGGNRGGTRVSDDPLAEIPSRTYVPELTGRPINQYGYAACPFHDPSEENPETLSVNGPNPTLWKCWSDRCGRSGDIYVLAGLLLGIEPPLRGIQWLFVSEQVARFYERAWGIEPGWGDG